MVISLRAKRIRYALAIACVYMCQHRTDRLSAAEYVSGDLSIQRPVIPYARMHTQTIYTQICSGG